MGVAEPVEPAPLGKFAAGIAVVTGKNIIVAPRAIVLVILIKIQMELTSGREFSIINTSKFKI
jgi:hypothetical protein